VNTWKVILATLLIFGAGLATGWLASNQNNRISRDPSKPANVRAANPWQVRTRELLHRMDRELALTPEQHKHIEKIIADSQERTKAIWKPIAPQMNKEIQSVCEEIREGLTPDQRKKFDNFAKARQNHGQHHPSTNANGLPVGETNFISTNATPVGP